MAALLVAVGLGTAAAGSGAPPVRSQDEARGVPSQGVISQPSLGEIAREVSAQRSQLEVKNVPLFTNDNLPKGGGLSVFGPSISPSAPAEMNTAAAGANPTAGKEIAYLRRKLSEAQTHLQLHQRELAALQQQISQSKMQWYPNPSQTLMQEYSRGNISNLASQISDKQQQIAQNQQDVANLTDQLQRDEARFGWVNAAAQAASSASRVALPPGIKPGTPEYWEARIQAAREQLSTAKEEQSLEKNELSLLKLQQLRSLDPNVQANLASSVSAKQDQLSAAAQAIEQAQEKISKLEQEARKAERGKQ
ncbi:MAG: hypothetical protein ACRD11_06720 [Terriglobia bacterium]